MLNQQFQKVNQLVVHQKVRTTAIKNATKPRNYKIRAFLGNWNMEYLASPIPDRSKPQCLICYEILSENKKFSVKRHYLSKHSTSIEKNSNQQRTTKRKYRNTRTKIKTANLFKVFNDRKLQFNYKLI